MSVGIIGYGRFGRLAAGILAERTDVVVCETHSGTRRRVRKPVRVGQLREVAAQEYVLLCMPVSSLESVLRSIVPYLTPGALVADVCAVKRVPCALMKQWIPRGVQAVGTHPLFGPDSFGDSIEGHRVILCRAQSDTSAITRAQSLLTAVGVRVETMTPAAHDRLMAETVFLTQCVGRWLAGAHQGRRAGATAHYEKLRSIIDVAMHDSVELYEDMWKFNPAAAPVVEKLGRSWRSMEKALGRRGPGKR